MYSDYLYTNGGSYPYSTSQFMLQQDYDDYLRHFTSSEFTSPTSMSCLLLDFLDNARHVAQLPFVITSSHRKNSRAHSTGLAVDIKAHHASTRFRIVEALIAVGFNRIGVYDRHIHADLCDNHPSNEFPYPVLWVGTSS